MLNFFKSPLRIAEDDYNLCKKNRAETLLEFRRNAAREILLMHPDAALLMGATFDNFLAYSRKNDALISGGFIDKYFPELECVEEKSIDAYVSATRSYKDKINEYSSNLHIPRSRLKRNESFLASPERRRELFSKGYVIDGEEKGDMVIAAKVCINDIKIAESNCVNPKSPGYFASKIYNSVMLKEVPSDNGISAISLSLMTFGYTSTGIDYYEMLYDDYSNFKGDAGFSLFKKNFSQIIDFISSMEEKINAFPQVVEQEREQWEDLMPGLVQW